MNAPPCPNRLQLERLMAGQLAYADVERLAGHVEQCGACVQTLHGLKVDDTLAEMLRGQAQAAKKPLDPVVRKLIERVRSLGATGAAGAGSAEGVPVSINGANAPKSIGSHSAVV